MKMPNFMKGLKIAQRIGNYYFMIDAYKKNVLLASTYGYYNTASYFNEKIRKLSVKYNNEFELANNYNSMGYNCCVTEEYELACEHYNHALQLFMEQNDIDFVNETVYNLAMNTMMAMDFETADNLFQLCLKCVNLVKSNSVRVCNISKIYGMRALCNYELGRYYNTMINLQYAEQFMGHIMELEDQDVDAPHLWDDDLVIFYTVSAWCLSVALQLLITFVHNFLNEILNGSHFFDAVYIFTAEEKSFFFITGDSGNQCAADTVWCFGTMWTCLEAVIAAFRHKPDAFFQILN